MIETTTPQANTDLIHVPHEIASTDELFGGFEFAGVDTSPKTAEGDFEAIGPMYYWSDGHSKVGVFGNEEYDGDGYPMTVAKSVVPTDGGDPYWQYTHICPSWESAIRAAKLKSDFQTYVRERETGELYQEWEERTGGTDLEPGPYPWDEE
jgi:hypothetical protein